MILLALAGWLVGCDAFYRVVVENHMDEPVTVLGVTHGELQMRPCSVRSSLALGPPYGTAFGVTVRDAQGRVVYRTQLRARNAAASLSMTVTVPAHGIEVCPTPAPTFTIHVGNHKADRVELYQDGKLLGTVEPKGEAWFGPFPGSWRGLPGITVRDAGGKEWPADAFGAGTDYDLGQVPEIHIGVN
jgi:hypothetical protein